MLRLLLVILVGVLQWQCQEQKEGKYVCPPCEMHCDDLVFAADGVCPHCKMNLIQYVSPTSVNEVVLGSGSGNFLIGGGAGHADKTIQIFYHLPKAFNLSTKVLLVLPGAGRNGATYRDAWIAASEAHNVLVLSPSYSEKAYPQFWNYNLAGMLSDVQVNADGTDLKSFTINTAANTWLFHDFDRVFELVKSTLQLRTDTYDVFGHSAGGQLLHRMAIFNPESKADRLLAANSGWYTVPTEEMAFPLGLLNSPIAIDQLKFENKLVLFLGAEDNANETRGELQHTSALDKQGLHRLARGTYFFEQAQQRALEFGLPFNWTKEIVPGVGHDFKAMSKAAAAYLYE